MLWLNVTSAIGWLAFLTSLRLIEPCLVQILYFGIGPVSVVWIERHMASSTGPITLTRGERVFISGLLLSVLFAGGVAIGGVSGMTTRSVGASALGAILAATGGVAMSVSTMQSRTLNDAVVRASLVFSLRYPATLLLAIALALMSPFGLSAPFWSLAAITAIGALFIVIPSYVNQVAILLASPLTVRVVMASAPVLVFLLQTFEGRLSMSPASLAAAIFYGLSAASAGVARQRAIREGSPRRRAQPANDPPPRRRTDPAVPSDAARQFTIERARGWHINYPL